ncbi:MAG TPA: DUF4185 domain-containing protein [Terriglobia bacterium]|nr:DUF4185 domain-containing protein [Terriglobia bacterium]
MSIRKALECQTRRYGCVLAAIFILWAAPALFAAAAAQECIPSFPFKEGWWGADAAYSIPLPDGRVVWIFGDTLYGKARHVEGDTPRMVRNSIGISTCQDGQWNIDYVIRNGAEGHPLDFFQASNHTYWYWALDGFFYKGDLWVTLLRVRNAPVTTSAAFAFRTAGADIARVSDLSASPQKWKVNILPLVPDGVQAYPTAAAVVEGEYAYIFAFYEKKPNPMLLTRIPLKGLSAPKKNLQYLAKDGTWKPGLDAADAKYVLVPGASEMSVRYHPSLHKWVTVMIAPGFPSEEILFRTAPRLTGPWTKGQGIYKIPDVQPGAPSYDRNTFCYAAKEHPEFEPPGKLLFTYVCNTMKVDSLNSNLNIYFPKAVIMPMPKDD